MIYIEYVRVHYDFTTLRPHPNGEPLQVPSTPLGPSAMQSEPTLRSVQLPDLGAYASASAC